MAGGNNPYAKRRWDEASGKWIDDSEPVIPDPSATIPGAYIGGDLLKRLAEGTITEEDQNAFGFGDSNDDDGLSGGTPVPVSNAAAVPAFAEEGDVPDAASGGANMALVASGVGGIVLGLVAAFAAIVVFIVGIWLLL